MFCPACATAVEAGAVLCPNCGEALPVMGPPPAAGLAMPAAVRRAVLLLWVCLGIGALTVAVSLIALISRVHSFWFAAPVVLITLLDAVAIVLTARRANLGRFLIFALVAYSTFNMARFGYMLVQANPGALISLLELGVRLYAVYLLLRPESNAWFTAREPLQP